MNLALLLLVGGGVAWAYKQGYLDNLLTPAPRIATETSKMTVGTGATVPDKAHEVAAIAGTTLAPTDRVQLEEVAVSVVPPGGSQPVTQTVTQVYKNYDPGNPQPGTLLMSPTDLSRKMGYYTPSPPRFEDYPEMMELRRTYAGWPDDWILSGLVTGSVSGGTSSYKMTVPEWNYYMTFQGSGFPPVTEQQARNLWDSKISVNEYRELALYPDIYWANRALEHQYGGAWG